MRRSSPILVYDDVILGAIRSGPWRPGRAALCAGSPEGLGAEPLWAIESADRWDDVARDVHGAGDVNGDGFGDVLVSSCGVAKVAISRAAPRASRRAPSGRCTAWTAPAGSRPRPATRTATASTTSPSGAS